jgi:rod shape-determining protein MreC
MAIVLLVLAILSLPIQTATQLKLALGGFFLPLIGLTSSSRTVARQAEGAILPRRVLLDRIDELKRENERLRMQIMQSNLVWLENLDLRQALGWKQQTQWDLRFARVTLREPANWWRTIQIDLGQRDGVVTNLPVLTSEGLVGKVDQVGLWNSRVVLMGDPNCRVSAVVEDDQSQDGGIVQADSSSILDPSIVELTFLGGQSVAKPGALVVTSGQGGVFPKGIPIGKVIETRSVGFGMSTEARVKLSANLKRLDYVWVKFP